MTDASSSPSQRPMAGYMLVTAGLAAILVGLFWKRVVPPEAYWSNEQAAEYNEAYDAAHSLTSHPPHGPGESHEHTHGSEDPGDLEAARERLLQAQAELDRARTMQNYTGRIISILGVVLAVAGAAVLRRVEAAV